MQVQQTIRRVLIRDTLLEHERIRLKGAQRIEKAKENKVTELKKTIGISSFAVSRKDAQIAKTQISAKIPQNKDKEMISLKLSQKNTPNLNEKGKEFFGEKAERLLTSKESTRQNSIDDEKKVWKSNKSQKGLKENQIKKDFFKAKSDLSPGDFFKKTLRFFFSF